MPKMKTKSGAKKRFRVTANGRVKARSAKTRHMMMNKPKAMKRQARGLQGLCEADTKIVLENWMPYANTAKKRPPAKKDLAKKKAEAATKSKAKGGAQ